MVNFLLKRFAWGILVLLLVAVITFFLSRVVPADPAAFLAGQNASEATVQKIRAEYGLDRPLTEQFASYMVGLAQGDLGESIRTRRSVSTDLAQYLPATLELLLVSFTIYLIASFSLAVMAARRPGGFVDGAIRLLTMVGTGIPVFWLGMALQFLFFYKLHWLPIGARFPIRETAPPVVTGFLIIDSMLAGSPSALFGTLKHLTLPALTIVINLLAVGTRLSRAALIQEQSRLYVRTARGKGLGPRTILYKHVLRNALSPILTATTMQFGYMISWVILVEVIFDWPGIGLYAYQSFQVFDYSPVIALAIVSTAGFVLINLLMDILYPIIDPRVQSVGS
ncbi:ABC transporter permease [Kaistia algarum]|uniref:ABC transporter permease n=1 Tax=Kaistia algarum TaxID=2083279 RepID=UPI000CE7456C|nr:ABC transporter permease [Kaistia algarum]MCX5516426.1 ABC transporter permease [Kaistia algarum]PPE77481.1 ABC transporter permease [Kaistia algarum]